MEAPILRWSQRSFKNHSLVSENGGIGFLFCGEAASSLPSPLGKGDRAAVDRILSYIVDLRRSSSSLFHTASTLSGSLRSPPSPRGEGFISGIALLSYRSLPHWGRGTAPAVDRMLSLMAYLRRSSSLFFTPLVPYPARSARHLPLEGKAVKLSGRTFLAPHRGSCPKGLCKRTGFLGVKRRENPVRRHFERSEMRGLRSGIA